MSSNISWSHQCIAWLYKHHRQGQAVYTTSAGQDKIWLGWEPSPSMTEIKNVVFFRSTIAANLCVCKHHTKQNQAITSADWFTTVIPWRQLTVVDIHSPFVSFSFTAFRLRRNSHRAGLSAMDSVHGLQVQSPWASQPSYQVAKSSLHTNVTEQQCFFQPALVLQLDRIILTCLTIELGKMQ